MRLLKRYILLIACLLLAVAVRAQGSARPSFFEVQKSDTTFQVTFRMGSLLTSPRGEGFVDLTADGMVTLAPREGLPALPQESRLVMLPRGSQLTLTEVREEETGSHRVDGWLRPYGGATIKGAAPKAAEMDYKAYGSDLYRAGDPIEVEDLGRMGEKQVFRLTVHPVAYRPADSLILSYSLTATLATKLSTLNSQLSTQKYLIVSRPQFREDLQPFVRWKRQEGYDVVELYADTNKRDIVKAMIAPYFAQDVASWPRYLLLVGDAAQLQSFFGTTYPAGLDGHITDLYYAEFTGDYLPDAIVGRWPVNSAAELAAVVEKTLRYEQGIDLDTNQLKRMLLVAGTESQDPAPTTTNGQVRYVGREAKLVNPALDTLCYYNPASSGQRDAILQDLQQGASLLNYTAHCTVGGWSNPSVSIGAIETLDNPQPLLYVNNCCQSNAFTGTCFGEALLRMPQGGAIGVIGATNSTLWNEDYYWAVGPKYPFSTNPQYDPLRPGAFDRWTGRDAEVQTQGELLMAGNLAVSAFGSPYDQFYWEIYCLFGDPSLRPYIGVPQQAAETVTEALNGATQLSVVGTAGATVTALQVDSLIGVGTLDATGHGTLTLRRALDTLPLIITASGYGLLPQTDTLAVERNILRGVALRDVVVSDSTVTCRVENIGQQRLDSLYVVLGQREEDTLDGGTLIAEQALVVDSLLPQQSVSLTLPVVVTVAGQHGQASLYAQTADTILTALSYALPTPFLRPSYLLLPLMPDGDRVGRLEAQQSYLLESTVEGTCDSMTLTVTALPTADLLIDTSLLSPLSTLHFTTPDTLTHLQLATQLHLGRYSAPSCHYLVAGERMDSFEEGFGSYPWRQGGTQGWVLDSVTRRSGRFSVRSGNIDYRQTSDLLLEVYLPRKDTLTYWLKTSTEAMYDKFQFYVDGDRRGTEAWGESDWTLRSHTIAAGRHTLRWRYVKDESGDDGSDCVWIDDVRLPLALWDSAYGWFGTAEPLVGIDNSPLSTPNSQLTIYPNPTTGTVTVDGSGTLHLYDLYGREVLSTPYSPLTTLHLESLPDGIYLLLLRNAHGITYQRLILQHE